MMSATMDASSLCLYWQKDSDAECSKTSCSPSDEVTRAVSPASEQVAGLYNQPAVYYIEGRAFPVETLFAAQPHTDYLRAALALTLQLHRTLPPEYPSIDTHVYLFFLRNWFELLLILFCDG